MPRPVEEIQSVLCTWNRLLSVVADEGNVEVLPFSGVPSCVLFLHVPQGTCSSGVCMKTDFIPLAILNRQQLPHLAAAGRAEAQSLFRPSSFPPLAG